MSPKKKVKRASKSLPFADSDDELEKEGSSILTPKSVRRSKHSKETTKKRKDSSDTEDKSSDECSEEELDSNEEKSDRKDQLSKGGLVHETVKAKLKEIEKKQKSMQRSKTLKDEELASELLDYEEEDADGVDDEMDIEQPEQQEEGKLRWKENLAEKAQTAYLRRRYETPNLRKLVYGNTLNADDEADENDTNVGGLFKIARKKEDSRTSNNGLDCSRYPAESAQDWDFEEVTCQRMAR